MDEDVSRETLVGDVLCLWLAVVRRAVPAAYQPLAVYVAAPHRPPAAPNQGRADRH